MPNLDDAVANAGHLRIDNGMAIAALALVVFDNFITIDQEVELIWRYGWSWITYVFLLNRFSVPLLQLLKVVEFVAPSLTPSTCHTLFVVYDWGATFSGALVEGVLILRVYALYGQSKAVLFGLLGLVAACVIAACTITGTAMNGSYSGESPAPSIVTCYAYGLASWFFTFYIPSIVFETTIFVLTLVKTVQNVRNRIHAPIYHVLCRDGFVYFVVIFVMMLSNVGTTALAPFTLASCLSQLTLSVISIMGSRLLLNLRAAARPSTTTSDTLQKAPSSLFHRGTTDSEVLNLSTFETVSDDLWCASEAGWDEGSRRSVDSAL